MGYSQDEVRLLTVIHEFRTQLAERDAEIAKLKQHVGKLFLEREDLRKNDVPPVAAESALPNCSELGRGRSGREAIPGNVHDTQWIHDRARDAAMLAAGLKTKERERITIKSLCQEFRRSFREPITGTWEEHETGIRAVLAAAEGKEVVG